MRRTTLTQILQAVASSITVGLLIVATGVRADERILAWESEIRVQPDSTLEVRETLRVRSEGENIRRGIFRDFPTVYTNARGERVVTGFDVHGVTRDGHAEPYRVEKRANGVRVWIGDAAVELDPGEHTYTIGYASDRQLGYFVDHDELYWNVTGNGWAFPIDAVSARVTLPAEVPADSIRVEAYTGPAGAKGREWTAGIDAGAATYRTTRVLAPGEGLTIVASWPKGHVTPPGAAHRAGYLFRDAWPALFAAGGLALLIFYYWRVWKAFGRDPPGRIVVPHYEPPPGQSPASMRYLTRMGYDDRCFAAAVLALAVKGGLRIEQQGKGLFGRRSEYTLHRTEPKSAEALSEDEWTLRDKLFASGSSIELDDKNHVVIGGAKRSHAALLKKHHMPSFFRINGGWHAGGIALSLLLGAGVVLLAATLGGFGPNWWFLTPAGWVAIGAALLALLANGVFGKLLKAPTVAGRGVMDHIAGFRLFLDVAEGDELKLVDAPPLTPQLYEKNLPAALALDVEQRWAERFATVFATQAAAQSPSWYSGDNWNTRDVGRFTSSLGSSFSTAISSASTAPGSSSGSGGGGSSGGGGGGGGGGGW
jgi:uncharacterized membrane protein YgcG